MKELVALVADDPLKALLVILAGIVIFYVKRDFTRREKQYDEWEKKISAQLKETEGQLKAHSNDMGLATKAINGDMLQIKNDVFSLKQDLLTRIEMLREFAGRLELETKALAHVFENTVEKFDDRFGRLIAFKEELKTAHGKIIRLEESTGKLGVLAQRFDQRFQQIAKALQKHEAELQKSRGTHEV